MPGVIGLLSALLVVFIAYQMIPVASSVRVEQFDRLRGASAADDRALPFWRALLLPLNPLAGRFTPQSWRDDVRRQLYWANFEGTWLGWNEVEFWGMSFALGALLVVFLLPSGPLVWGLGGMLGVFGPGMLLRNTARKIERALLRELPDALYLLAALVTVGLATEEALRRLSEYRGILARWLGAALARSHGRDLLVVLLESAREAGQPKLIGLAAKLALIERKGTADSANLLRQLADDHSREYRIEAEKRAKEVGGSLIFPILGFFFLPYFIILAAPLFANMLSLFGGA